MASWDVISDTCKQTVYLSYKCLVFKDREKCVGGRDRGEGKASLSDIKRRRGYIMRN